MHGRFHTLDLMRGTAAMTVMAYHAGRLAPYGYLAVDLFFVLSGFVLTQAYRMRLGGWRNFRDFAVARAIRLGPLMLGGAIIGLLINGGSLWTLLLVPIGDIVLYPENIPLWSLLFEIAASLAFAGLFLFGIVAWAMVWSVGFYFTLAGILDHGTANLGYSWTTAPSGLARTAFSFSTGIAISWWHDRFPLRKRVGYRWS